MLFAFIYMPRNILCPNFKCHNSLICAHGYDIIINHKPNIWSTNSRSWDVCRCCYLNICNSDISNSWESTIWLPNIWNLIVEHSYHTTFNNHMISQHWEAGIPRSGISIFDIRPWAPNMSLKFYRNQPYPYSIQYWVIPILCMDITWEMLFPNTIPTLWFHLFSVSAHGMMFLWHSRYMYGLFLFSAGICCVVFDLSFYMFHPGVAVQ